MCCIFTLYTATVDMYCSVVADGRVSPETYGKVDIQFNLFVAFRSLPRTCIAAVHVLYSVQCTCAVSNCTWLVHAYKYVCGCR